MVFSGTDTVINITQTTRRAEKREKSTKKKRTENDEERRELSYHTFTLYPEISV